MAKRTSLKLTKERQLLFDIARSSWLKVCRTINHVSI